jgi:hypothetical protein
MNSVFTIAMMVIDDTNNNSMLFMQRYRKMLA